MTLRDALNGFVDGLRKSPNIPVSDGILVSHQMHTVQSVNSQLEVVDTSIPPTNSNVPGSWSRHWLGPGKPFSPVDNSTYLDEEKEMEPRSFQYISSVNSTISPRSAYGLLPFSDLKAYASGVPEVALCVRLTTEELKSFVPTIVDDKDNKLDIPSINWMTTRPDGFNPWPVWLSRFLYNVLVYDAPAVYKIRRDGSGGGISKGLVSSTGQIFWKCSNCSSKNEYDYYGESVCSCGQNIQDNLEKGYSPIVGLRVIDGSTIFSVIDERGEQPQPPAPAFTQVIWGMPKMFLNTYQLWYRPRFLRADAPYGKSFIEDSLQAVKLLESLWEYEYDKYQIGNIPEMVMQCPPEWKSADSILEYEEAYNQRMAGNIKERAARIRFMPYGMTPLATKELSFNRDTYDVASNAVRISAGIPKSEVGEAPEGMLGGKGFAEAMASAFYRMNISPLQGFIEGLFNDVIEENGFNDVFFKLKFPSDSIDPEKEETKYSTRFQIGGITRDEYREAISMDPMGGEEGKFIVTPGKGGEEGEEEPMKKPIDALKDPIEVLGNPLDVKKPIEVKKIEYSENDELALAVGYRGDMGAFADGVKEEMEHSETFDGDMQAVAGIAKDHLEEDPDYYLKLKSVMKASGVESADDLYFGVPIVSWSEVDMPNQGANKSMIVGIGAVGQDVMPAVWKPVSGEKESLKNWIGGDLYKRSEAVYLLDRELSPDSNHYLVPVTWVDKHMGEDGSVQHYIKGRQRREDVNTYGRDWIERSAVLDFISGQVDRINKNWLSHPEDVNRPILIDNDLSFPSKDVNIRSSFIDSMLGKELSTQTLDSVYLVLGNIDLWDDIGKCLEDSKAVNMAKERAQSILDEKRILTKS